MKIVDVRLDGGTQPRGWLNEETVAGYAEALARGDIFPPARVVYDGTSYWLIDGFHRIAAARRCAWTDFECSVDSGTLEDAQWRSYSVNAAHGLQRSNEDKRRAIRAALLHPQGGSKSDREIATHVGVSHPTVAVIRAEQVASGKLYQIDPHPRLVRRNGTVYAQKAAARAASQPPADPAAVVLPADDTLIQVVDSVLTRTGHVGQPANDYADPPFDDDVQPFDDDVQHSDDDVQHSDDQPTIAEIAEIDGKSMRNYLKARGIVNINCCVRHERNGNAGTYSVSMSTFDTTKKNPQLEIAVASLSAIGFVVLDSGMDIQPGASANLGFNGVDTPMIWFCEPNHPHRAYLQASATAERQRRADRDAKPETPSLVPVPANGSANVVHLRDEPPSIPTAHAVADVLPASQSEREARIIRARNHMHAVVDVLLASQSEREARIIRARNHIDIAVEVLEELADDDQVAIIRIRLIQAREDCVKELLKEIPPRQFVKGIE